MYWSLQYVRFKAFLNLQTESKEPTSQFTPNALNLHKMTKAPDKEGSQMNNKLDRLSDPKAADTKTTGSDSAGSSLPKPPAAGVSSDSAKILSYLPNLRKSQGDLGSAVSTFKKTLMQTWHEPGFIDRGAIAISGVVEVTGSKAKLVVDVMATFHPETNQLKVFSVRPRSTAEKRLAPQG